MKEAKVSSKTESEELKNQAKKNAWFRATVPSEFSKNANVLSLKQVEQIIDECFMDAERHQRQEIDKVCKEYQELIHELRKDEIRDKEKALIEQMKQFQELYDSFPMNIEEAEQEHDRIVTVCKLGSKSQFRAWLRKFRYAVRGRDP